MTGPGTEETTIGKREKNLQNVGLSKRLECIVELAMSGDTLCDVGCDHAHVPIRLLQSGRFRRAIGMDVIDGPLGKARGNLELYGLADRVELRLSDGLNAFRKGEADTLVVTGMGGTLMRDILLREPDKTCSLRALVLGPQSDPDRVRAALRELGFSLQDERLIYEDGKYYPVLRAVHAGPGEKGTDRNDGENGFVLAKCSVGAGLFPPEIPLQLCREAEDLFGPLLLRRRDPVLREFLVRRIAVLKKIRDSVSRAAGERQPEDSADFLMEKKAAERPPEINREEQRPELPNDKGKGAEEAESPEKDMEAQRPELPDDKGKGAEEAAGAKTRKKEEQLRKKHLDKKLEIEHTLDVYQAAMAVFYVNADHFVSLERRSIAQDDT